MEAGAMICAGCPLGGSIPPGRQGLLWTGEKFYASPADFRREAEMIGVSRKVSAIPRGFVLGQTWVYLAHRHAFPVYGADQADLQPEPLPLLDAQRAEPRPPVRMVPGVFMAFQPTGVDLVVGDELNPPGRALRLAELVEKDATAGTRVRVVRVVPQSETQQTIAGFTFG
jgi:hypothetical protein